MATNQLIMLEELQMDYHTFRKDQLLTDTQLNELINYFEDQDRLTRTCLIGVGLVCGLGLIVSQRGVSITVTKGCGVTTDGDLLLMDTTTFRDFKAYQNRAKGTDAPIYDPFFPPPDTTKQIDLWELVLPDKEGNLPEDSHTLLEFTAVTDRRLQDMVALLYLEYYLKDPDKCTAIDCDNQGAHQIANLKVLLLTKESMEKVINRDPLDEKIADSIYKKYHDSGTQYPDLPVIKSRRVILNSANTVSISALTKAYKGVVQSDGATLIDAIEKLYNTFKFMIDAPGTFDIANLKQILQQNLATTTKLYHSQYLYDFYKDIIDCYNELRELLFRCMVECCPDKYAFPKHIMLGELNPTGVEPAPYRHDFYPSPAVSENREKLARCRLMWTRLVTLVHQFTIPDQPSTVRITPSRDYDHWMEQRAVPFYYKNVRDIVPAWNYGLSKRGSSKSILSYHAAEYANGNDTTLNPLNYNIDSNNFFRIEGHLGKTFSQALEQVVSIKNNKSIPFDVVGVRVDRSAELTDIDIDEFECQFEDLNAVLKAWLVEQNCLYGSATKFFTGFTPKKDLGFHANIDDFKGTAMANVSPSTVLTLLGDQPSVRTNAIRSGVRLNISTGLASALAGVNIAGTAPLSEAVLGAANLGVKETPLCSRIYTPDKTVVDNLNLLSPVGWGIHFNEVLNKPINSADEIVAEVKRRTFNDINAADITADEKEVIYEAPIMLIAHIYDISRLKPYSVNEINLKVLEAYMERMERLCKYVKLLRSRMETIFNKTNYTKRGYETYYIFQLQQLISNCCAAEKLESLLEEIERRKKKILESLQFSNYANQHPGLEHKAGVHRGGTFVLVYSNQPRIRRDVNDILTNRRFLSLASSSLTIHTNIDELIEVSDSLRDKLSLAGASIYDSVDSFAYYVVTNQGTIDFDAEVDRFMKVNGIRPGSLEEQRVEKLIAQRIKEICARLNQEEEAAIADKVVIADFCLPYLCCSDCPPMTFIVPRQDYSLALPKAAACSDEARLEFRKEPVDGTVKAAAGFEATVVNEGGRTYFDPSKVAATGFGKDITFTINDQVTDCKIKVFKHPTAQFQFNILRQTEDVITVQFNNTSDDDTGNTYVYEWNFSDGRPPQRIDNKEPITITYRKAVLDRMGFNGRIPVTLSAVNGPCKSAPFELVVNYEREVPVRLALPAEVICDDATRIPFTVSPPNGVVKSPNDPATVVEDGGRYFFDPRTATVIGQPIKFTVNDKDTTCTIIVLKHPNASFTGAVRLIPGTTNVVVSLTNTTDPANNQNLTYTWKSNDGQVITRTDTAPFDMTFNLVVLRRLGLNRIEISLTASNRACSGDAVRTFDLPNADTRPTCVDTVRDEIQRDITLLEDPRLLVPFRNDPMFADLQGVHDMTHSTLRRALTDAPRFSTDVNLQNDTLAKIDSALETLYANRFSAAINRGPITIMIRSLLKLALNVIRCVEQVSGNIKEREFNIIEDFIENIDRIAERNPQLNERDQMLAFIETYMNEVKYNDTDLKDRIAFMYDQIKQRFNP